MSAKTCSTFRFYCTNCTNAQASSAGRSNIDCPAAARVKKRKGGKAKFGVRKQHITEKNKKGGGGEGVRVRNTTANTMSTKTNAGG